MKKISCFIVFLFFGIIGFAQEKWTLVSADFKNNSNEERGAPSLQTSIWRDIAKNSTAILLKDGVVSKFTLDDKEKVVKYEFINPTTFRLTFIDNLKENKTSYTDYTYKKLSNNQIELSYQDHFYSHSIIFSVK